jgi:hypothetical protein
MGMLITHAAAGRLPADLPVIGAVVAAVLPSVR